MDSVKFQMTITSKTVIDVIPICNLRNKRTWIFRERVKGQSVDGAADDLDPLARK